MKILCVPTLRISKMNEISALHTQFLKLNKSLFILLDKILYASPPVIRYQSCPLGLYTLLFHLSPSHRVPELKKKKENF